uniref:Nonstructural protein NS1 n=1 Tax=Cygnus atratus Chaphamaparvovirus TaxID=2794485 RepID=A0A8A4XC89_9VIRU|nr:MAG: nonstructural protein NS1 [Cygnus atratus Chaphamaparvovirus]
MGRTTPFNYKNERTYETCFNRRQYFKEAACPKKTFLTMEVIKSVWEENSENPLVNNPGWWTIILNEMDQVPHPTEESPPQWPCLLDHIRKLIQFWSKKWKKWAVSSFDTFSAKMSTLPVAMSPMSFSMTTKDNFLLYWRCSMDMDGLDETDCSAILSNQGTYTSSTTVPMEETGAETHSDKPQNLSEFLDRLGSHTSPSSSSPKLTSTMSSSISFLSNGALEKYGLEEKVGKRRLTVRLIVNYSINGK